MTTGVDAPRSETSTAADRGSIGLFVLIGVLLVAVLGVAAVAVAADLAVSAARASTAADAAALAAAGASPLAHGHGDPREQAMRLAAANGARLLDLDDEDWPVRVTVRVAAEPNIGLVRALVPQVAASAAAALHPER